MKSNRTADQATVPLAAHLGLSAVIASTLVTRSIEQFRSLCIILLVGCVPRENADSSRSEPEPGSTSAATFQRWRPHATVPQRVETGLPRLGTVHRTAQTGEHDRPLDSPFHDSFERDSIGSDWTSASEGWTVESGALCGRSNRNRPVWLKLRLPRNARISYLASAKTSNGDLKAEAWGDGRSFARGNSYNDATSYILIFGGWKNQLHVLSRLDEHDPGRIELRVDPSSADKRLMPVAPNVNYRFVIERQDGKTIVWRVNDVELVRFEDKEPLYGREHDHFGFNNWDTPVCFDDLTITPLPE